MCLFTRWGISGTALKWFCSYLSNHTQIVTMESSHSASDYHTFADLQGPVLGPYYSPYITLSLEN